MASLRLNGDCSVAVDIVRILLIGLVTREGGPGGAEGMGLTVFDMSSFDLDTVPMACAGVLILIGIKERSEIP